jgi:hypothetical protein
MALAMAPAAFAGKGKGHGHGHHHHHGHTHYRAGYHYKCAPHGWHRYQFRSDGTAAAVSSSKVGDALLGRDGFARRSGAVETKEEARILASKKTIKVSMQEATSDSSA